MAEGDQPAVFESQKQPPALATLLKTIDAARKCFSLYGADHPNTAEVLENLTEAFDEFRRIHEQATCVFTEKMVIINDHIFEPSGESRDMAARLRARGVMAITLTGVAAVNEVAGFLTFLNTEPREIRAEGSPSTYLRARGVARIVATDAIYNTEDGSEDEHPLPKGMANTGDVDRAIAAAIDWLSKQEEGEDLPRLPIADILSKPDMAARLIREAVSKLHVSRRNYTDGELATEVIHDLKGLAANESEDWDSAAPQIRRAISKLPKEMLPAASGFTVEEGSGDKSTAPPADIGEVEGMVARALERSASSGAQAMIDPKSIEHLFGATADGLLSNWRRELQPSSVILSSGATLDTLMTWEDSATEHGRIAQALASMIQRAAEISDFESAPRFAGDLLLEVTRESEDVWRRSNARTALQTVETEVLRAVVEHALRSGDYGQMQVAAGLVETVPDLAVSMSSLIGDYGNQAFGKSLRRGIVEAGRSALPALGQLIHDGDRATKESALDVITAISQPAAVKEIADALASADVALAACVVKKLGEMKTPSAVEVCVRALSHRSTDVRLGAIAALGKLGGDTALERLVWVARKRSLRDEDAAEKVAAIHALAGMGRPEAITHLKAMATHTPFFGRSRYEPVRAAAKSALDHIRQAA